MNRSKMKTGVELEYWVTDRDGNLCSSREIAEQFDFAEQEFVDPMLELISSPHADLDEMESELIEMVASAVNYAQENGYRIVPTGTPLYAGEIKILQTERGRLQEKIVGENIQYAKRVAGTHFHFEQTEPLNQLNRLTALDPLLGLMNSSPYDQGENIASSSRNQIYRFKCYSEFPRHGQLWEYADSMEEWQERMDKRFEEFKQAGIEAGTPGEKMDEYFSREDALWIPIRLREELGTVEWRSPDANRLSQVIRLLRDMKPLVKNGFERPEFEKVEELSRKAILEDGVAIKDYAEEIGIDTSRYRDLSGELKRGDSITREEARELRLEAADKLEEDLFQLSD